MAAADMPALRTNSRIADDKAMGLRSGAPSDSSNATTPRKRQRTTSPSEESTKSKLFSGIGAQLAKDPDIWLPDGNLVLEADGIAFKVYGGLLAAQSEVFRELLSDAAQDRRMLELNPFAEICPTIRLTDHPDDLRHLLRVVFFSSSLYVFSIHDETPTYPVFQIKQREWRNAIPCSSCPRTARLQVSYSASRRRRHPTDV